MRPFEIPRRKWDSSEEKVIAVLRRKGLFLIRTPTPECPNYMYAIEDLPPEYKEEGDPPIVGYIQVDQDDPHNGNMIFIPGADVDRVLIIKIVLDTFTSPSASLILHGSCTYVSHYSNYSIYLGPELITPSVSHLLKSVRKS